MGLIETSVAALVGNLLAALFFFGLHITMMRDEAKSARLLVGGVVMLFPTALALGPLTVGEHDPFAFINAAAFLAAIASVLFCWGIYTIGKHDERGDMSTAPLKAWVATLAPIGVAVAFLWRYAPIG